MRRGPAGLILGLSLMLASIAWAGFVLTSTVLDPGRSERLADQMLDNEVLRAALVTRLAASMGAALPAGVPVPTQQLEEAADTALDDPRVDALVRDGIVRVHRNALEGKAEPVTLDASALGVATRDALVGLRPELAVVLPEPPPLTVELPTTGLSWLGRLRRLAQQATLVLGLLSVAGILASLLLARNRPAILRRVSLWAFGAAAFWLIVGYGVPFLARSVAPSSTAIVSASIDVFFGAMIRPAVAMGVLGAVLFGLSFVWASVTRRQGIQALQPGPTRAGAAVERRSVRRGGATSNIRPARGPGDSTVGSSAPAAAARTMPPPAPDPLRSDPTQVYPTFSAPSMFSTPATPASAPDARSARPTPRWVEGVGYVEGDEPGPEPDS